jgi:hypothetical protein
VNKLKGCWIEKRNYCGGAMSINPLATGEEDGENSVRFGFIGYDGQNCTYICWMIRKL